MQFGRGVGKTEADFDGYGCLNGRFAAVAAGITGEKWWGWFEDVVWVEGRVGYSSLE